jgi:hypothetical protein
VTGRLKADCQAVVWTEDMLAKLRQLRATGEPLFMCAVELDLPYRAVVMKARELKLNQRMNRGRVKGLKALKD